MDFNSRLHLLDDSCGDIRERRMSNLRSFVGATASLGETKNERLTQVGARHEINDLLARVHGTRTRDDICQLRHRRRRER